LAISRIYFHSARILFALGILVGRDAKNVLPVRRRYILEILATSRLRAEQDEDGEPVARMVIYEAVNK
jgi:hypothetical protein